MTGKELREPTFLVLTALAAGRRHGYALMEDVAGLSGGRVALRPGTLYAALDRLVGEGLVLVDGEEVVAGRLRRYFRLTEAGEQELATHARRMHDVTTVALRRLGLRAAGA
jgi:DNA-binding PadR family transcriptional regulator